MDRIAILFAGQGAQTTGMGLSLYENSVAAREVFDFGEKLRPNTLRQCFSGPQSELDLTENTQPCLFLTDLACAFALREAGISADAVAGFSVGELPALCYADAIDLKDAFQAVCLRAESMSKCAKRHPGGMAAILRVPEERLREICAQFNGVYPVNFNCPGQVTCSFPLSEEEAFLAAIKAERGRSVKLPVSGPFHTPYMQEAEEELSRFLLNITVRPPKIPVYSNLTGEKYPDNPDLIRSLLSAQVKSSVKFESIVRNLYMDGIGVFLEAGPGRTLSNFVSKTLGNVKIHSVCDPISLGETLNSLEGNHGKS